MSQQDLVLVPWQSSFFSDPARYRVAVCGRRSGKTTVARSIIYTEAARNKDWIIWYVAPTFRLAKKLMFNKLLRMFPRTWLQRVDRVNCEITLKNGTEICCKGSDNPDSLLGEGIHLLILDEYQSQKNDVWWTIRPTLSDHKARVIVIGTPRGYDHFHELWFRGWSKENPEPLNGWSSYQVTTEQAGTIDLDEIEDARQTMSPKQFNQEYNASFTSLSGVVYDSFDSQYNVCSDINLTPTDSDGNETELTIRIGMDFNVNPMTAIVGIIVPSNISKSGMREAWIVDEVYLENSNTREMVQYLHGRYGRPGEKHHKYSRRKQMVYPDPAGGQRRTEAVKDSTNHTLLQQGGFLLKGHDKAHPSIIDSVNEVNGVLCNASGVRRLYIHPRCTQLIKTLKGLTYKNNLPDKTSNLDHMSDCLRYFVHNEFPINTRRRMVTRELI